ncbi:MAG: hypothetical protein U9O06_08445 [Euryarchaeota archaeon]|nr:hypothetical protein [Euryarchaeota archaeon]
MGRLRSVLKLTAVTHTVLAAGVAVHSRLTDREAGIWVPVTLGFGLFGVAGYLLDR